MGIRAIPTGIEHGTVTALVEGRHFEITILRRDVETDGRHARRLHRRLAGGRRRAATSPSMRRRPIRTAGCTIHSAASTTPPKPRGLSAIPRSASARTWLVLYAFFVFHAWYGQEGFPDAAPCLRAPFASLSCRRCRANASPRRRSRGCCWRPTPHRRSRPMREQDIPQQLVILPELDLVEPLRVLVLIEDDIADCDAIRPTAALLLRAHAGAGGRGGGPGRRTRTGTGSRRWRHRRCP